jgi:hypothetical protein
MQTYDQLRAYSDKSLDEAKSILCKFFYTNIQPTTFFDDTTKAIDLIFEMPKIIVSHRARKNKGLIQDITIKTESKYGKFRSNGERIICEYDKLKAYDLSTDARFYYFYCYFDEISKDITDYVIIDMKKLIPLPEFQDGSIFIYRPDKINTIDGGSKFNCINLSQLYAHDCVVLRK